MDQRDFWFNEPNFSNKKCCWVNSKSESVKISNNSNHTGILNDTNKISLKIKCF